MFYFKSLTKINYKISLENYKNQKMLNLSLMSLNMTNNITKHYFMHVEMHLYVIMMMMLDDLHMKVVIKNVKLFQLMVHFLVNPVLYRVDQGKKIVYG